MATLNLEKISIVHWCPDLDKHRCGYCKNEKCSISDGMWAEQLSVEDYQNLIDRGWRRSGNFCYKPIMNETCCPLYTIRCEALKFHPSKSQKKIIKRFNRYVTDGIRHKEESESGSIKSVEDNISDTASSEFVNRQKPAFEVDFAQFKDNVVQEVSGETVVNEPESVENRLVEDNHERISDMDVDKGRSLNNGEECGKSDSCKLEKDNIKKGLGPDPNRPPCKKAKLLRLERKQQKLMEKGLSFKKVLNNTPKSLEELIEDIPDDSKLKLRIQLEKMTKKHPLFQTEAKLFEKYQIVIHNEKPEDCDEKQFWEFLVDTPLRSARARGDGNTVNFGSYHQQYWLDDKLIAVGVLDILPRCVSSVYFFYDPDYRFLTLGTYGSLREIHFVRSLHQTLPSIQYYYMGYYIHSCPKMRYKGRLSSSLMLCPETYRWFPIENCIPKLEASKYSRLDEDVDAVDENACTPADVDRIKILIGYNFTLFANYKRKFGEEELFQNIGKLIGKKCVDSILFINIK